MRVRLVVWCLRDEIDVLYISLCVCVRGELKAKTGYHVVKGRQRERCGLCGGRGAGRAASAEGGVIRWPVRFIAS